MRILVVFGWPPKIGGHYRSASAFLSIFSEMGYKTYVAAPPFPLNNTWLFSACQNVLTISSLNRSYPFINILSTFPLVRFCRAYNIDVINSQDFRCAPSCFLAALVCKAGFVYTQAGGAAGPHFPPENVKTVYYSQELVNGMSRRYYNLKKENVHLIRARIDISRFGPAVVRQSFLNKYGLHKKKRVIVMAMRMAREKQNWFKTLFALSIEIAKLNSNIEIILAGDGPFFPEISAAATSLNKAASDGSLINMIGAISDINEMNQLYNYARMVIGHGRGILEAMACGKPVAVLGEAGQAQLVNQENVAEIAEFNFSGRHFGGKDVSLEDFLNQVMNLFENDNEADSLGKFSRDYIETQMKAEIGARQLREVYHIASQKRHRWRDFLGWFAKVCLNNVLLRFKLKLGINAQP